MQEAVNLPPSQELFYVSALEVTPPHRGIIRSPRADGQKGTGPRPQDREKVGKKMGAVADPRNRRRHLKGLKFPDRQRPIQVPTLAIKEIEAENGKLRQKQFLDPNCQDQKIYNLETS